MGKPSKPKAPKCPEVDDIMMMVGEYYAGPMCMFKEMGWLDEECNSDDALIEADIMTLPTEISASLMGEEYDQCVNMTMMYAGKMLKAELKKETKGKCSCEDYSEEDQMALMGWWREWPTPSASSNISSPAARTTSTPRPSRCSPRWATPPPWRRADSSAANLQPQ